MWPQGLYQATWNSPVTSRLLIEAGASLVRDPWPCSREDVTDVFGFTVGPSDISVLESTTGYRYNAKNVYFYRQDMDRYVERFSVSYVTGSHLFKAGIVDQQHVHVRTDVVNSDLNYTLRNGVPTSLTQYATPYTQ